MLLDQLVRLARGKFPRRRDLAVLAQRYVNILDVDKDSPYRLRFGETIGQDWRQVDRGFWAYAAEDPVATHRSTRSCVASPRSWSDTTRSPRPPGSCTGC